MAVLVLERLKKNWMFAHITVKLLASILLLLLLRKMNYDLTPFSKEYLEGDFPIFFFNHYLFQSAFTIPSCVGNYCCF